MRQSNALTGDPPFQTVSKSGRLLNGQHRLNAVLAANTAIEVVVVRGLEEAAFATYDQGLKRDTLGEVAGNLTSFGDRALLTAAASLIWEHERRPADWRYRKPSAAEVVDIVEEHPELLELRTPARRMAEVLRPSIALYCAYIVRAEHQRLGQLFVDKLETGADLPGGHVIIRLRRKLAGLRKDGAGRREQIEAYMAAWDQFWRAPGLDGVEPGQRIRRHPRLGAHPPSRAERRRLAKASR